MKSDQAIRRAVLAERERIAGIITLPIAQTMRKAAQELAFGADITPAEAAGAMERLRGTALRALNSHDLGSTGVS